MLGAFKVHAELIRAANLRRRQGILINRGAETVCEALLGISYVLVVGAIKFSHTLIRQARVFALIA